MQGIMLQARKGPSSIKNYVAQWQHYRMAYKTQMCRIPTQPK